MKKILLALLLLAFVPEMRAQVSQQYKIEVGQFNKLKVSDNVNVVYRCVPYSTGWAQYSGTKELADAFILTSVENSSNFTLTVENPAPCAEFSAKEIGNGRIVVEGLKANTVKAAVSTGNGMVSVSGSCRDAVYQMVGTGIIAADRLEAQNVECKILGSGSIGCWAQEKLTTKGIGSTKIYYKGDPVIKKSGGGTLYPLPEGDNGSYIKVSDEDDVTPSAEEKE